MAGLDGGLTVDESLRDVKRVNNFRVGGNGSCDGTGSSLSPGLCVSSIGIENGRNDVRRVDTGRFASLSVLDSFFGLDRLIRELAVISMNLQRRAIWTHINPSISS